MHLFYEQAFDALYQRHDSHKPGGYKRQFKTSLSEDIFKRLLSYFSLVTYYDEKFEFDRNDLLSYAGKAASLSGVKVEPAAFIDDLIDCVCVLVQDGMSYSFSHRSFQEYFAAYCLAYVTQKSLRKIVNAFAKRPDDETISLLVDMNPELFREQYVFPCAEEFKDLLILGKGRKGPVEILGELDIRVHMIRSDIARNEWICIISPDGTQTDKYSFFMTVLKAEGRDERLFYVRPPAEGGLFSALSAATRSKASIHFVVRAKSGRLEYESIAGQREIERIASTAEIDRAFLESRVARHLPALQRAVSTAVHRMRRESASRHDAMKEIFNLDA